MLVPGINATATNRTQPSHGERQIEREFTELSFVQSDRTRSEAEETRMEVLKHIRVLQMERIPFDYGVELRVSHLEGLARHGNHLINA